MSRGTLLSYGEKNMFYRVVKNGRTIDVLDKLMYCKYQLKHKIILNCSESEAEGILSSDNKTAYHLSSLNPFPVDIFDTVILEKVNEHEYEQLKKQHCMSAEEIIDQYTASLLEQGVL